MTTLDRLCCRSGWFCALLSIVYAHGVASGDEYAPRAISRLAPARIELVAPFREMKPLPVAYQPHADADSGRDENRESIAPPAARSPSTLVDGVDIRIEPIAAVKVETAPKSEDENRSVPQDFAVPYFAAQPTIHYGPAIYREQFLVPARRLASDFAYGPVYFEDSNLERHGTSFGLAQPAISAAHFFTRVPALPYLATAEPPWNDYYPRDPFAPGRPAPHVSDWPPFDVKAATLEAGLAVGLILLVP